MKTVKAGKLGLDGIMTREHLKIGQIGGELMLAWLAVPANPSDNPIVCAQALTNDT